MTYLVDSHHIVNVLLLRPLVRADSKLVVHMVVQLLEGGFDVQDFSSEVSPLFDLSL